MPEKIVLVHWQQKARRPASGRSNDTIGSAASSTNISRYPQGLPDAKVLAKQYFEAMRQVLDTQRRFTEALFTVADTARTLSDQAVRATEHASNVTQAATEGLACVTKNAGEQATATVRVSKGFAS